MGDVLTLIEKAEEEFDEKESELIAKKMMRDEFTLEDFKLQLNRVQKLGSISDIVGMLPNMPSMGIGQNMSDNPDINDKKIKHLCAIINSMTKKERQNPKILNGRRRLRISKGSGRYVQEINQLIRQFFEMKKYMKKPFFRKMIKKFDFLSKMG